MFALLEFEMQSSGPPENDFKQSEIEFKIQIYLAWILVENFDEVIQIQPTLCKSFATIQFLT